MVEMSCTWTVMMSAQWHTFVKTRTLPLTCVHLLYVSYFPIKLFKAIVLFEKEFPSVVSQLINLSGI